MLSITSDQIDELCRYALIADREARSDLVAGYIRDEDDYTSNFTGALRRIINSNSRTGLVATSYLLGTAEERLMGCDGAVVIRSPGFIKVATFEAKFPRFTRPRYGWDYAQTSAGLSHFSDQLERQKTFASLFAIFEMFYCEFPFHQQPPYLQSLVSSCVWHGDAVAFDSARIPPRTIWTQDDLKSLLQKGNLSIGDILQSVCECTAGVPIPTNLENDSLTKEFRLRGNVLVINAHPKDRQFEGQGSDSDDKNK